MSTISDRVAFIMPRYAHDNVRVAHKDARSLHELGYQVVLVCRDAPVDEYLGMRVIAARGGTRSRLRPFFDAGALLAQALRLRAGLYVLTNPYTLPLGIALVLLGRRVVYITHEDFLRKVELRPYIPRPMRKLVGYAIVCLEQVLARFATAVIATQPDVQARYPNALLLENAPLTRGPVVERARTERAALAEPEVPTLIYAGAVTRDRGLFRMLDLLVRLNQTRPWRLELVGAIDSRDDRAAAESHPGWRFVSYLGQVHHSMSLAHIKRAHIGLALLDDVGGYAHTSITKLYEYMLLETPFVASDFARWRESIRGVRAGLFVDVNDIESIAAEIDALWSDSARYRAMQQSGRVFIEREFNWELVAEPLRALANEACPAARPSEA